MRISLIFGFKKLLVIHIFSIHILGYQVSFQWSRCVYSITRRLLSPVNVMVVIVCGDCFSLDNRLRICELCCTNLGHYFDSTVFDFVADEAQTRHRTNQY